MWVCALSDTQANSETSNTAENSAELFSWRPLTWCSTEVILSSLLPADDFLDVLASRGHHERVIRLHHAERTGIARTHLSLLQPGHWCQITCNLICMFKMYTSSIILILCTQISTQTLVKECLYPRISTQYKHSECAQRSHTTHAHVC